MEEKVILMLMGKGSEIKIVTVELHNNLIVVMKSDKTKYLLPETYHLGVAIHLCPE